MIMSDFEWNAPVRGFDGQPYTREEFEAEMAKDRRLKVINLGITFATDQGDVRAVDGVSLYLDPGEILALVGESGSGKSVTARSILGLLPETASETGTILVEGTNVVGLHGAKLRQLRGERVSMVFQEPSGSLNPVYPIWWQIGEGLRAHHPRIKKKEIREQAIRSLRAVGIPNAEKRIDYYPHEFSGGQKQRIVIAMALAMGADLIIADEPTTALDVTVQAEILALLRHIRDEYNTSILLITHNMGVVADLADSVAVMYKGQIIERAPASELFYAPIQPYTKQLLASVPHLGQSSASEALTDEQLEHIDARPAVVTARAMEVTYPGRLGSPAFRAVRGVDFTIHQGEVFGLVGESGSGKTTIGRAIAGLEEVTGGSLNVLGVEMRGFKEKRFRPYRKQIGFVFQDPATSFDPQQTVGQAIQEPMDIHRPDMSVADRRKRVVELLEAVQLPASYAGRFPHELSGGQRQRISFARALALEPQLLIADEPTSALDVSVQAKVLDLFKELQKEFGFACLFITHDLAVVDMLAHRIGVLNHGQLLESGRGADVLRKPGHAYTKRLIASLPVPDPVAQAQRRAKLERILQEEAAHAQQEEAAHAQSV
jgi:peptide/nickel transport system ATP-binding protein